MNFRAALRNVCRVAVKFKPEVFDLRVAESLENASVEFVAGSVGYAEHVSNQSRRTRRERTHEG